MVRGDLQAIIDAQDERIKKLEWEIEEQRELIHELAALIATLHRKGDEDGRSDAEA